MNAAVTPVRILRMPAVEAKVGLSKTQIYALMKAGEFPRCLKLSKHATGWLEHEVDAFLMERAGERAGADR